MTKQLKGLLAKALPLEDQMHVCGSYDIIGDIAIIRVSEESKKYNAIVANAIMSAHKSIKTVLAQTSAVQGDLRLRNVEYVAGQNKTTVIHKEYGCLFSVDLEKCYFSPRLHDERMRIARLAERGETVVNMFAGVGCFSILVAKHSGVNKVYSIDVNPVAVQYMQENIRLNGVYGKVVPILGDAKEVIEKRLCGSADRVLMPLPEKALEYLSFALLALKKSGGSIHYYGFEHALKNEDPVQKVRVRVAERLTDLGAIFEVVFGRVVRSIGPNWYQVVLDVAVEQ